MLGLPSSTFALKLKISIIIIVIMAAVSCLTFMWFIHMNTMSKSKYRYTSEYEVMNIDPIDPSIAEMIRKAKLFPENRRIHNNPDLKVNAHDYWEAKRTNYNASGYNIAIGCAITTRGSKIDEYNINDITFFQYMYKSFCKTASSGFSYHFYIAHDHDDPFFLQKHSHRRFEEEFYRMTDELRQTEWTVHLHFVDCDHSGKPAWAQNDAMMAAYLDNMDYYYRVNDDSMFQSLVWLETMIHELLKRNPPNVGVVGPAVMGGNQYILTHDFVHRTHIDIFGFYYPRRFTDWWADDWISNAYPPNYIKRMYDVRVRHFLADSRYEVSYENEQYVQGEIRTQAEWFEEWLNSKDNLEEPNRALNAASNKVVALSLYGADKAFTYGAIRNTILAKTILPGWKMRIYTGSCSYKYTVPKKILNKLKQHGALIYNVNDSVCNDVASAMWRYLVADDTSVDFFIIRDSNSRLSAREAQVILEWTTKGAPCHCIRDHETHRDKPIVSGLFGGRPNMLRDILKVEMKKFIQWNKSKEMMLKKLWKILKSKCMSHDSVSCESWPNSKPFEHAVRNGKYIGQHFTEFGQAIKEIPNKKSVLGKPSPQCATETNNELGKTIRKLGRMNMWSMDYDVAHIYAIKDLLETYGINTIDNSLSPACAIAHTCATGLKMIDNNNGFNLTPYLIQKFYNAYKNDALMEGVDFFLCVSPISMCRLYEKFDKPMLLLSTNRYEFGNSDSTQWKELDMYLELYSSQPQNVIAASNLYDLNYIKYYTSIQPVLIPLTCGYVRERYKPSRETVVVTQIPNSDFRSKLMTDIANTQVHVVKSEMNFRFVDEEYSNFKRSDLAQHPAVVMVPKQVSTILFCEVYQMGVPVFIPSVELLTSWHVKYNVVSGKSLLGSTVIGADLPSSVNGTAPNPNKHEHFDVKHWLGYADFYQWPHVITFNSVEDLLVKLGATNFTAVSERMKAFSEFKQKTSLKKWSQIFETMFYEHFKNKS